MFERLMEVIDWFRGLSLDNVKVYGAAAVGVGTPVANVFIDTATPILSVLVTIGQIAVAAVTVLYIFRKAQAINRDNKKKD